MDNLLNQISDEELNEAIQRASRRRRRFLRWTMFGAHAGITAVFTVIAFGMIDALSRNPTFQNLPKETGSQLGGAFAMLTIAGLMGVFYHFMTVLGESGLIERESRKQIVAAALSEEIFRRMEQNKAEKAKRQAPAEDDSPAVRLSDDGELVPVDHTEKPRRSTLRE
jgi:hypothetical protein